MVKTVLSNDIAATGVAYIETDPSLASVLRGLLAIGREFFEKPHEHKQRGANRAGQMTGWRRVGVEYSQSPDRPDLNETFCFRLADAGAAHDDSAIVAACRRAQTHLDRVAASMLADIQVAVGAGIDSPLVRTANESWLQLNYSWPSEAGREFIQDAHEDGHLLTLLFADQPGLEVLPLDEWVDGSASPDRLIAFGGECGALLTDDYIRPILHRVRAHPTIATRLSVAYFVNPDLDQTLEPWRRGARNHDVDLLRWGQENPVRFGLPRL